jgi:hypothetical protein
LDSKLRWLATLIKAEITITDLQRSVARDVHSQDGLDKPCELRASSKAGEIGLGIGKYQCSQDSGLSKALMWARVSSAIARIAIEGGAPAPLFINFKSNRLLVSFFTGKTLHRELAAVIQRGAEAKLT